MRNYTDATPATLAIALRVIPERCTYQRNLVRGTESMSGSTIRGRARQYASRYAASRRNALERLARAGLRVSERRGAHGVRILVLRAR